VAGQVGVCRTADARGDLPVAALAPVRYTVRETMAIFSEFIQDVQRLSESAFVARLGGKPVLMLQGKLGELSKTATQTTRVDPGEYFGVKTASDMRWCDVYPLLKREEGSSSARISIGRLTANDVCIPYPAMSKFHAFIDWARDSNEFRLSDNGSSNGTTVEGARLTPRQSLALLSGMRVGFGPYVFTFHQADAFYAIVQRYAARSRVAGG
jgi:hypothetical protein